MALSTAELYAQIVGQPRPAPIGEEETVEQILARQISQPNINVATQTTGTAAPKVNPVPTVPTSTPQVNPAPTQPAPAPTQPQVTPVPTVPQVPTTPPFQPQGPDAITTGTPSFTLAKPAPAPAPAPAPIQYSAPTGAPGMPSVAPPPGYDPRDPRASVTAFQPLPVEELIQEMGLVSPGREMTLWLEQEAQRRVQDWAASQGLQAQFDGQGGYRLMTPETFVNYQADVQDARGLLASGQYSPAQIVEMYGGSPGAQNAVSMAIGYGMQQAGASAGGDAALADQLRAQYLTSLGLPPTWQPSQGLAGVVGAPVPGGTEGGGDGFQPPALPAGWGQIPGSLTGGVPANLGGQVPGSLTGQPGGIPTTGGVPGAAGDTMALLLQRLGQAAPQADPNGFQYDPALMGAIRGQLQGGGLPSWEEYMEAGYSPVAAQLAQVFDTAQTQAFENLISRGVLASGETAAVITDLANQLGTSQAQVLGNLAIQYAQERNDAIESAITQFAILEGNRASMYSTITTANMEAAVSIQQTGMNTLATINSALIQAQTARDITGAEIGSRERIAGEQIASTERIVGQELASSERIAGQQIASAQQIAGMDIASRQSIAQLQASTSIQVANISAQAALQQSQFNRELALQQINATMTLQGVDWNRYLTDPMYAAQVVQFFSLRQDIETAIEQATAVTNTLPPPPGNPLA